MNSQGFTLVELMVALSILATILIMSTVIMMQISRWYSKGVNSASVQNATRNITADITSALQFSGATPIANAGSPQSFGGTNMQVGALCLGKVRYTFVIDRKLGTDHSTTPPTVTHHVLWRDTMSTSASCNPLNLTTSGVPNDANTNAAIGGYEMVPGSTRLTQLELVETPAGSGLFRLTVGMAYGDRDLIIINGGKASCRGDKGTEYCAASNAQTTVSRRLK